MKKSKKFLGWHVNWCKPDEKRTGNLYICDRMKCELCHPTCKYTTDPEHSTSKGKEET